MIKIRNATHEFRAEQSSDAGRSRLGSEGRGLAAMARGVYRNDHQLQPALLAFMLLCYGALLGISWRLALGDPIRLTFNSMLSHLLHGQFDVDPKIVLYEGYSHNGRVYAYWGIWPALLRLPLWIVRRMDMDMTMWSCLAAGCIAGMAKVRAVLLVRRHGARDPVAALAIGSVLAYILLGGSEVGYLRVSIYQEVILWASAFAAIFVYSAVKGLVNRRFDMATLCTMALCAGLAMLTRVSTGIGLLMAMVLLLIVLALEPAMTEATGRWASMQRLAQAFAQHRILAALGILTLFVAITGAVNYFRWGNPTAFVNYSQYCDRCSNDPMHLFLSALFNLKRIPFGLIYYFFPVWVLHGSSGQLFMEKTQTRLFDYIELPPSSFFLTDLLPLCFIALFAIALWRRRPADQPFLRQLVAIGIGLFVPCLLMLTFVYLAYRFRMEFYPEIDFLAFLGLYLTVTDKTMLATFARFSRWIRAALAVSIVASFVTLMLYDLSFGGPAQMCLRDGITRYYGQGAAQYYHRSMSHFFATHRSP